MKRSVLTMLGAWFAAAALAAGVGGMGGCEAHRSFNIDIVQHEGLRDARTGRMPSIELDLIAMPAASHAEAPHPEIDLVQVSAERHFDVSGEASRRRQELRDAGRIITMHFSDDRPQSQRIVRSDPFWKHADTTEVLVLVDYLPDARTQSDLRLLVPLDPGRWRAAERDLRIELRPSSLHLSPQPRDE